MNPYAKGLFAEAIKEQDARNKWMNDRMDNTYTHCSQWRKLWYVYMKFKDGTVRYNRITKRWKKL